MPNTARSSRLPVIVTAAFLLITAGDAAASGQIPLCPRPDTPLPAAQRSNLVKTADQCRTAFNSSDAAAHCTLEAVSGNVAPYAECAQCTVQITCTYTDANGKEKQFGINGYKASTDTLEDLTRQGIRTSPVQDN